MGELSDALAERAERVPLSLDEIEAKVTAARAARRAEDTAAEAACLDAIQQRRRGAEGDADGDDGNCPPGWRQASARGEGGASPPPPRRAVPFAPVMPPQHYAALASSSSDARDDGVALPGWGQQASSVRGGGGPQIAQPLGPPSEGELAEGEPPEAQQVVLKTPPRRSSRASSSGMTAPGLSRPPSWEGRVGENGRGCAAAPSTPPLPLRAHRPEPTAHRSLLAAAACHRSLCQRTSILRARTSRGCASSALAAPPVANNNDNNNDQSSAVAIASGGEGASRAAPRARCARRAAKRAKRHSTLRVLATSARGDGVAPRRRALSVAHGDAVAAHLGDRAAGGAPGGSEELWKCSEARRRWHLRRKSATLEAVERWSATQCRRIGANDKGASNSSAKKFLRDAWDSSTSECQRRDATQRRNFPWRTPRSSRG